MDKNFKFLKGNIETIILNALYNGDKYGYEIAKEIKEKTENKYEIKQPTLYTYLKRLQEQELVESYWGDESFGGRRKYFKLTRAGKIACERYMSEWNFHRNILDSLVAEPTDELPEYVPEDNLFLGTKSSQRKRHTKKDFNNEKENQLLFEQLMKLTETTDEKSSVDKDSRLINDDANTSVNFDIEVTNLNKSEQVDLSYISNSTEENTEEDFGNTPIIERSQELFASTEFIKYDKEIPAEIEPTIVFNNGEDLLRITDCDEKFAPQQKHTQIEKSKVADTNFDTIARNIYLDTPPEQITKIQQQSYEVAETHQENQYKVILGSLLGEQIINTDEKVSQITPQAANYDESCFESLSITETADNLSKEGYRIRFYNTATSQYRAVPMLIRNKINCITAWSTLCIFYILLGLSWLICGASANIAIIGIVAACFLLVPLYFTYVYLTKPNVRVKPTHKFRHSVLKKVIIFIFCSALIICVDLLMFRIDFSDRTELTYKFLIPEITILMLVISECLYNFYLKHKQFYN